jgi:muramoyltetrapeptide carboxypeptidase
MAVALLESWDLRVQVLVEDAHHFYLAGPDSLRSEHFHTALKDDRTRAIFCLRGGYGSPRLLPFLEKQIRPQPKILVGYSDVTSLQAAVARLWPQVDLIYGPNVATKQLLDLTPSSEVTRNSLRDLLFLPKRPLVEEVQFIRPGRARGRLIGGCLSMLVSLLGTPYAPKTGGAILFLEDVGEAPFRIDRMLTHLRNAGKLRSVSGVVFGEMRNCNDPYNELRDVLRDLFRNDNFPVAFGLRSGHGEVNLSLRLGVPAALDSDDSAFRMG